MRIDLPSGTPAELVRPPGEPTLGVVVAPDIFGLRPLYVDICTRLANENSWVVCAPEPFPGRAARRRRRALRGGAQPPGRPRDRRPRRRRRRHRVQRCCAHRVLHGRDVRAEGGRTVALPPRRRLLRDDPGSRGVEGIRPRRAARQARERAWPRRRSRSSASTIRTRRPRMSRRSRPHASRSCATPRPSTASCTTPIALPIARRTRPTPGSARSPSSPADCVRRSA